MHPWRRDASEWASDWLTYLLVTHTLTRVHVNATSTCADTPILSCRVWGALHTYERGSGCAIVHVRIMYCGERRVVGFHSRALREKCWLFDTERKKSADGNVGQRLQISYNNWMCKLERIRSKIYRKRRGEDEKNVLFVYQISYY